MLIGYYENCEQDIKLKIFLDGIQYYEARISAYIHTYTYYNVKIFVHNQRLLFILNEKLIYSDILHSKQCKKFEKLDLWMGGDFAQ